MSWLRIALTIALCAGAFCASCETLNIGGAGGGPHQWMQSVVVAPDTLTAGESGTATVNFTGVTGPFTFTFTFSGGVTPLVHTVTVNAPVTTAVLSFTTDAFMLTDDADGKDITVTVTGLDGNNTPAGPASDTFHVDGIPCQPPVVNSIAFDSATCIAVVDVSSADGDDLTVEVVSPLGISVDQSSATVVGGFGTATFHFAPDDIFAGGAGDATFTVSDDCGSGSSNARITCPGIVFAADTLYAVPLQSAVAVGDPVRIVVATGATPNPFQYLTGVRVTAETASGYDYNANSFNVGLPGGTTSDVDGAWTAMNPGGGFLHSPNFIQSSDAGGGLTGIDFSLTPISGSDVASMDGVLFNFEATFTTAGTYRLGFQDVNVVSRTYYQDGNQTPDYFWGDISNDHAGIPNSVTVVDP